MFFQLSILLLLLLSPASLKSTNQNNNHTGQGLKAIIENIIPLRADGKMNIPTHFKHIKLDIGLSSFAPMSQHWLTHETDLLVFGFEPNPECVLSILEGKTLHPEFDRTFIGNEPSLDTKFIGKSFFLIPCALGLSDNPIIKFFITSSDPGCSSMYAPKTDAFPSNYFVKKVIDVPLFSLAAFFELFPFDTHPVIDYIKIDAQGADLNIVQSGKNYLSERVIYVTLEANNYQYENTINSIEDIDQYMRNIGFIPHKSSYTTDPTYFNPRYTDYIKQHNVKIYQH